MPEDQVTALPPEVRQMVMTGTTAMMNNSANSGIMAPGVMMDMSSMMQMGINADMNMGGSMMPVDGRGMMMNDGAQAQQAGNGTPEQGIMSESYAMMSGEYPMQVCSFDLFSPQTHNTRSKTK